MGARFQHRNQSDEYGIRQIKLTFLKTTKKEEAFRNSTDLFPLSFIRMRLQQDFSDQKILIALQLLIT